jgi:hypothetical protein
MLRRMLAIIGLLGVASLSIAGTWTSNNFLYKPSTGARGETEKQTFENGLDQIDQRLGKEIWVGDPGRGTTLQSAVTSVGGNQTLLRIPSGTWNIGANLTIPANITLKAERGVMISVANGVSLTINGTITADDNQIFSWTGTGAIVLSGLHPIKSTWFGDTAAGVQKAINSLPISGGTHNSYPGTILLPQAVTLETYIEIVDRKVKLKGLGTNRYDSPPYGGTVLTYLGSGAGIRLTITTAANTNISLEDFAIVGNGVGENGIKVGTDQINCVTYLHMDNILVRGFTGAGIDWRSAEYAKLHRVQSCYNGGAGLNVGLGITSLVEINTCSFGHNTQEGIKIAPGATAGSVFAACSIRNTDIQSNGYEGIYVYGQHNLSVKNFRIDSGSWIEGNNAPANGHAHTDGVYYDVILNGTGIQNIGTVAITGAEWGTVQNKLGPELMLNGGFTTNPDTNWIWGTGWAQGSGIATHTATNTSNLSQVLAISPNTAYLLTYQVTGRTAGFITPKLGGHKGATHQAINTFSETITTGSSTALTVTVDSAGKTFTRSSGNWLSEGVAVGDWVTFAGFANGGNNSNVLVSNVTATVLTASTATGLVNEGPTANVSLINNLQFIPTAEFNGSIDNVSLKKITHRALFATGVDRLVCQGNQWENSLAFGTQCVFGAISDSDFFGFLSTDDPLPLWEWNEGIKVTSELHGRRELAGGSTTGTSVVLQNVNIPARTWSAWLGETAVPTYYDGGGSGQRVIIKAYGTWNGTAAKSILLTFGGQIIGTITHPASPSNTATTWDFEARVTYMYQTGGGLGSFKYSTVMSRSVSDSGGATYVTRQVGSLANSTGVMVYGSIAAQLVATGAGDTITVYELAYER